MRLPLFAENFRRMMKNIKLFATDVDGVLTDNGMYYSNSGDEFKRFNAKDGMGLVLLKKAGIATAIITAEDTRIVERRAEKLKIDFPCQGVKDKLSKGAELCTQLGISLADTAYIGDDVNDIELLKAAGLKACPADAASAVKKIDGIIILKANGGFGAVREFCELILAGDFGA